MSGITFTSQRASQQLDELVAEHVMGWHLIGRDNRYSYWAEYPDQSTYDVKIYYGDSEDEDLNLNQDCQPSRWDGWQWRIIEAVCGSPGNWTGFQFDISGFPKLWNAEFSKMDNQWKDGSITHSVLHQYKATAHDRNVAMCVAALKAMGHDPDGESTQ